MVQELLTYVVQPKLIEWPHGMTFAPAPADVTRMVDPRTVTTLGSVALSVILARILVGLVLSPVPPVP